MWNACSLDHPGKRAQVNLIPQHITAIAITETKLAPDNNVIISSFPYSQHRQYQRHIGGLAIFSRVPIKRRDDLHLNCTDCLFVETIGPGNTKRIIIGVVYRRLNGCNFNDILDGITRAIATKLPILIVGDYNSHHNHWEPTVINDYDRTNVSGKQLYDYIINNNLTVVNNMFDGSYHKPTHHHTSISDFDGSVIDLAITNVPHIFSNCITDDTSVHLVSDHYPVTIVGPPSGSNTHNSYTRSTWDTANANWPLYQKLLDERCPDTLRTINAIASDDTIQPVDGIERIWSSIMQLLNNVSPQCIQQRNVTINTRNTWYKDEATMRNLLVKHRTASRSWHRYYSAVSNGITPRDQREFDVHYLAMTTARDAWYSYVKTAKDDDWRTRCAKIENTDGTVNWTAFNATNTKSHANVSGIANKFGYLPSNGDEAVNNVASHLADTCAIPPTLHYDVQHHDSIVQQVNKIRNSKGATNDNNSPLNQPFNDSDVKDVFDISNPKSALGPDQIHADFLHNATPDLITLFTICLNYSWKHSVLPMDWKIADVCVIHKPGTSTNNMNSYRPISLTSLVVKAFERLILKRLTAQCGERINRYQSGFRAGHNTTDNLYYLWSTIKRHWNNKHRKAKHANPFFATFIDFSSAFDTVWHDGLLHKLHSNGITGRAWHWISDFLHNRQLHVVNNGHTSEWQPITAGVPQGAVLSPFLFVIYINDLIDRANGTRDLEYADDIVTWNTQHTRIAMASSLCDIMRWCYKWKLVINSKKSGVMMFISSRQKKLIYHQNTRPIVINYAEQKWYTPHSDGTVAPVITFTFVQQYKYLGVIFTPNLTWSAHADSVISKAKVAANMIQRIIRRDRPPGVIAIRTLVLATVLPIITYGWPVWRPSAAHFDMFLSILIRPLRTVLGLPRTVSRRAIMIELAIPMLTYSYHEHTIRYYNRLMSRFNGLRTGHLTNDHVYHESWYNGRVHDGAIASYVVEALKALLPDSYLPITNITWKDDIKWTTKHSLHLLCLQASRAEWSNMDGECDHLRMLWRHIPLDKPYMQLYLQYDNRMLVAIRARMRFDRTVLKEPASRHGGNDDTICNWCDMNTPQTLQHYMFDCTDPKVIHARHTANYPAIAHYPIPCIEYKRDRDGSNGVIIAFTDGSCYKDGRAGAAAIVTFPSDGNGSGVQRLLHINSPVNPYIISNHIDHIDPIYASYIYTRYMSIPHGTNNIGELYAIALAINVISEAINGGRHDMDYRTCDIIIATDSKYCIGALSQGHAITSNGDIINDISSRLRHLIDHGRRHVSFTWIRGHQGNSGNDAADHYAGIASNAAIAAHPCPPLPAHVPIVDTDAYAPPGIAQHVGVPSMDAILGVYPIEYGVSHIKQSLSATGAYVMLLQSVHHF